MMNDNFLYFSGHVFFYSVIFAYFSAQGCDMFVLSLYSHTRWLPVRILFTQNSQWLTEFVFKHNTWIPKLHGSIEYQMGRSRCGP